MVKLSQQNSKGISNEKASITANNPGMKAKRTRKTIPRDSPPKRSSVYRGVTRHRWTGRFEAHLWDKNCWNEAQNKKGRQVYLGAYDDEEAAAHAYDLAALKYWGQDTILNFPLSTYQKEISDMDGQSREEYIGSLRRKSPYQEFPMTKKVVLKLGVHDEKEKKRALKAVSSISGIESLAMDMKEKKLTVVGEVDPIEIVGKLKKLCHTQLLTVGPAKEPEKKKEEPKKEDPKKTEAEKIEQLLELYKIYYPHSTQNYRVYSAEENPNSCVIS